MNRFQKWWLSKEIEKLAAQGTDKAAERIGKIGIKHETLAAQAIVANSALAT